MSQNVNRRTFLKGMAAATGTAIASPTLATGLKLTPSASTTEKANISYPDFKFGSNGKFRVMQLTDTHYIKGDDRSVRALKNVIEMLDTEKPDLVIHTGDVIMGKPAKECMQEIMAPVAERKIPWVVALGNHDDEFGLNRSEIYDYARTLPYNVNTPQKGIHNASNDIITLRADGDSKPSWVFYLLDTGNRSHDIDVDTYDYLHFDQIAWYRQESLKFRQQNDNKPVPSLAFMHIPLYEYLDSKYDKDVIFKGNMGEIPAVSVINSGMFAQMQEMGDVIAVVAGHDHDSDYTVKWRSHYFLYGRYSGGDTVYNNLKPNGCRMFKFTQGQTSFRTYIRLFGGNIEQDLLIPDSFKQY